MAYATLPKTTEKGNLHVEKTYSQKAVNMYEDDAKRETIRSAKISITQHLMCYNEEIISEDARAELIPELLVLLDELV